MPKKSIFELPELNEEDLLEDVEQIDSEETIEETPLEKADKTSYDNFLEKKENIIARLENGEVAEFYAFNNEMKPTIREDKSLLQLKKSSTLKRGDIVLVETSLYFSVKRIIKFVKNGILLLGDNEKKYTLLIDRTKIIAKVIAKIENTTFTSFNALKVKKKAHKKFVRFAAFRTRGRIMNEYMENANQMQDLLGESAPNIDDKLDVNDIIVQPIEDFPDINFDEK